MPKGAAYSVADKWRKMRVGKETQRKAQFNKSQAVRIGSILSSKIVDDNLTYLIAGVNQDFVKNNQTL